MKNEKDGDWNILNESWLPSGTRVMQKKGVGGDLDVGVQKELSSIDILDATS